MRALLYFLAFLLATTTLSAQNGNDADYAHQFDFWKGEWDVNLRVQQADNSWADQHKSIARIYSLLEGKVILELWEEQKDNGISGYSLRYFDKNLNKWVLWFNWPWPNMSGSSSLRGEFRHGRGEFYSKSKMNDSTTRTSRFTFSDIKHKSLRWVDAH